MRRPSSFLLRCWRLGSQEERIEVEHIQSGTKTLTRSLADALEWLCAYDDTPVQRDRLDTEPGSRRRRVDGSERAERTINHGDAST